MFQISLFMDCQSEDEALIVLNDIMKKIENYIDSYHIVENEPYWKVDGWFKITCNVETSSVLDHQKAKVILNKISNKWSWDKGRISAVSSANKMGAVFCNTKLRFCNCWFEDFE